MPILKYVKRNIRRTPYQSLAAIMVMFLTFFVMSSFLNLAYGLQQILKYYESKPQAIAFFKDGIKDTDIKAIQEALMKSGKVTKFHYVSKDEALTIYRERNKNNPTLLELVTANILPASLEISTLAPSDLKIVADVVKNEPVVEEVVFPEDVVQTLTQATNLIRTIGVAVVSFLVAFSTLIIIMLIGFKIRIRKDEIATMKLLGATSWFVRIPYIVEGVFYAAGGAILGWALSFAVIWYFEPLLQNSLGDVYPNLFPINPLYALVILLLEFIVAFLVGSLGSLVAVRRYLKI